MVLGRIKGAGMINHIWMTVDRKTSDAARYVLRDLVLRMYWDDETEPSVESPLGDFFCCGFGTDYRVDSVPVTVAPARGLNCYFQMPFRTGARIVLINQHSNPIPAFFYQIDYCLYDRIPDDTAYFHAQWRRERITFRKGLCHSGPYQGKGTLCRDLHCLKYPGALLVGGRGSEILY